MGSSRPCALDHLVAGLAGGRSRLQVPNNQLRAAQGAASPGRAPRRGRRVESASSAAGGGCGSRIGVFGERLRMLGTDSDGARRGDP